MGNPNGVAPFADNWAYLKTELSWLDRLLMVAVSRQKREVQDLDDFALSSEDRVTSHWWKGIIYLSGQPGYDHARPPKANHKPGNGYAQQLEARIQASQSQGIVLALPSLRDRLQLTPFEKNVILLALAPEINQRFGRLYSYLQYQHDESDWDLPTVDLCLRLLCRNDQEWRRSRPQIAPDSRLVNLGLVEWVDADDTTLLSRHLRLNETLTTYLLSEAPDPTHLDHLTLDLGGDLQVEHPTVPWSSLVLPTPLLGQLKTVAAATQSGLSPSPMVLLAGVRGTGKTLAAQALATDLGWPLVTVDLATLTADEDSPMGLEALTNLPPCVLLLTSAPSWFGRNPSLDAAQVQSWVIQRRHQPGLTLLSSHYLQAIRPAWRQTLAGTLDFPMPNTAARQALWQRAIPPGIDLGDDLDWGHLAKHLPLSGGDITALAHTALALSNSEPPAVLTLGVLRQALALYHPHLKVPKPPQAKQTKSRDIQPDR